MNVVKIRPSIDLTEAGEWGQANAQGRQLALDTIEYMIRHDMPGYLGHVVRNMVDGGKYGGVEVGFFHVVAVMLME